MKTLIQLCITAAVYVLLAAPVPALDKGTVSAVIDGDTIVVDGHTVRLLGINTPEKARKNSPAEPGAGKATRTLKNLLKSGGNKKPTVSLDYDANKTDRYDRLLAHVHLQDGTWLNKALIEKGVAHVYSFPDNRSRLHKLLAAEEQARKAGKGMWQHPTWQVLDAGKLTPDQRIGQFRLVRGTPIRAARVGERIYLNYGENWRTDFTVEIPTEFLDLFSQDGIDPLKNYTNKKLLVRGRLKPVNGVLITATHPEQIRILTDSN